MCYYIIKGKRKQTAEKQNKTFKGVFKMLKFTVIVGLNDKDTKKQEVRHEQAYNRIIKILHNNGVEGATFTECKGLYIHENGEAVFENSIKIELLFIEETAVKNICKELKIALNQESVIMETINLDSDLI